ncbi:hypothetical protein [Streptomyces sp. NPDC088766]|uniref:hypothetical protein n=1 Tax=Streptomyces sp. NPDC088766 TaxID=3365893 RepID=UPI003828A564
MLDLLVQNRRETAVARHFLRCPLQDTSAVPQATVTDELCSYGAATTRSGPRGALPAQGPGQQDGERPPAGPAA